MTPESRNTHELIIRPSFCDSAPFEYDNPLSAGDRAQAVSDQDDSDVLMANDGVNRGVDLARLVALLQGKSQTYSVL